MQYEKWSAINIVNGMSVKGTKPEIILIEIGTDNVIGQNNKSMKRGDYILLKKIGD